jgi:hypothetical protein
MEQDATYIKGFNSGYKLAEFNPELWDKLKSSLSQGNEFERGLVEGAQEFRQNKEKMRGDELKNIRNGKDRERDRDLPR